MDLKKFIGNKDLIEVHKWMRLNDNIKNIVKVNTIQVSMVLPEFSFLTPEMLFGVVRNEINKGVFNTIYKELTKTIDTDYLNLLKTSNVSTYLSMDRNVEALIYRIISYNYKNVMTNEKVSSDIKDSNAFHCEPIIMRASYMDKIGKIRGKTDIFLYSKSEIALQNEPNCVYLFNDVDISIGDIKAYEEGGSIIVSVSFYYFINNCKKISIIESKDSNEYREYISDIRQTKIGNILGD